MFKKNFYLISSISFSMGLLGAHYFNLVKIISPFFYFLLLIILFFFLINFKKIFLLILFFIFLSWWRYSLLFPDDVSGRIDDYLEMDFKIIGKIISEPEIKNGKQKIKLKIYQGQDESGKYFRLKGKILITSFAYPIYNYGEFLEIDGIYLRPEKINNFDYGLYLRRFGITTVSYYPKIKKVENFSMIHINNLFYKIIVNIYYFKKIISGQFDYYLSYNSSAILKAMLLGDKTFLSQEYRESFSQSGLSHIIAISGMHISLLSSLFLNFLLFIGCSRRKSFYFSIIFLLFYLLLIGAPASACRASLMGFLSFLAVYMGRPGNLINVLFFSALILLLINPLLLFGDLGFQLSFLAVIGIIYIYPHVKEFLFLKIFIKTRVSNVVIDIIGITIAVQLIAAPILISSFNQFSIIAPISNLLVVWLLPIIISLSIIASILSFIFCFLAQPIYLVIDFILKYILVVSNISNKIPGSFIEVNHWPFFLSIVYYLALFYIIRSRNNKKQRLL